MTTTTPALPTDSNIAPVGDDLTVLDSENDCPPRLSIRSALRRLAEGELGSLRVLLVLAAIWTTFALAHDRFLTPVNLTNLMLQIAAVGAISTGVVLVLLLGEIDLSVGAVSGLAGAVTAMLSAKQGLPAIPAIAAGLAVGTMIGLFQGTVATRLGIPTFVVTLAGLLGWQGALLAVLGTSGTINIDDPGITSLTGTFLPTAWGWIVGFAVIASQVARMVITRRRRLAAGLAAERSMITAMKVVFPAAAIVVGIAVLNADRGVPVVVLILFSLVGAVNVLTTRTAFGRHIYAVGSNAEAARRMGIRVNRVKTVVFMLASTLAAAGGILMASRSLAVSQSSGGGTLLLLAIAGPVIAGVSLFGGRGTVWAALLGALVIGSIENGMDLLALESSVKFMVTGSVLLLAVSLDALSRGRRIAHGKL